MSREVPGALNALLEAAGSLVRTSSSGRVALARAAPVVPADALPPELSGLHPRLAEARERALEPIPAEQVRKLLKDAWGRRPEKVLDDLSDEPLAVTPASQVHRGELDGEAVAVKVQRPGLAGAVRNDLSLLDALAAPLGAVLPAADARALLREAREAALDELDLEHEASQQRQARRALRDTAGVVVPASHTELAGEGVNVSELLDGPTLEQTEPDDPKEVARALVAAHVDAWRRAGLVLTDPRPGHVVLLGGGTIGLLGTGVARVVPRERAEPAVSALAALRDGDESGFARTVRELGVLDGNANGDAYALAREILGHVLEAPARLDGPALATAGTLAIERLGHLMAIAAAATPGPHDLAPLRMLGQLAAVLSRLGVTEDWAAVAGR